MTDLTVIIPMFNSTGTLARTVRSLGCIAPENRSNVNVIAVDDGSSDASGDLFSKEIASLPGFRWNLMRKPNGGSASARNMALSSFSSGWTMFLDSDDELNVDPMPYLSRHDNATAVLFKVSYFKNGRQFRTDDAARPDKQALVDQFTAGNLLHPLSIIFKRECIKSQFDEQLVFLEDWLFWASNLEVFTHYAVEPATCLGRVHVRIGNKSGDQFNNGKYRVMAAEKLETFLGTRIGVKGRNNLRIQKHIGNIQMKRGRRISTLFVFPCSPLLYCKMMIYYFVYPLYVVFNPYGGRK